MRTSVALAVSLMLSGCLGLGSDASTGDDAKKDPHYIEPEPDGSTRLGLESGHMDAGRHFLESQYDLADNVTVTATFSVESPIEYAVISLRNCDTRAGSGTGFVNGGNATHSENFAPGTLCVTVEVRHDEGFHYELEVTSVPWDGA